MNVDPAKYFKRNKVSGTTQKIMSLENDLRDLSTHFIKMMTLCEALSQIVIEKNVVTEEEYHEHIKKALSKFQVVQNPENPDQTNTESHVSHDPDGADISPGEIHTNQTDIETEKIDMEWYEHSSEEGNKLKTTTEITADE